MMMLLFCLFMFRSQNAAVSDNILIALSVSFKDCDKIIPSSAPPPPKKSGYFHIIIFVAYVLVLQLFYDDKGHQQE